MLKRSVDTVSDFAFQTPQTPRLNWTYWRPKSAGPAFRVGFSFAALIIDALAIVLAAVATGVSYHILMYGSGGSPDQFLTLGIVAAFICCLATAMRNEYLLKSYLGEQDLGARTFVVWNATFVAASALAFLTKTTADMSRGSVISFYGVGLCALFGARYFVAGFVHRCVEKGTIPARRLMLVGYESEIAAFYDRTLQPLSGAKIIGASILRDRHTLTDDLALAAATARMLRPDDILILAPWSQSATIDACVETFLRLPTSIHLGSQSLLDKYLDARVSKFGGANGLNIIGRPHSALESFLKRSFDLVVASCGLVALAPVFALCAIAIKMESPGPVFFLQRRYGFNQEPFRIWKFRSMDTMDDGRVVEQVHKNDPRITRFGAFMRRTNIDELPQLINVVLGDMSLVGPRPHALAHDQKFDQTIAYYARRHNVKPGITGLAQVNGCRGETDTPEKMRKRIDFDLYYIDHWSFLLDAKILFLTLFSRKAYLNAR